MQFTVVLKLLGVLLILFSSTVLPPLAVSLWFRDGAHYAFLIAYGATLATGLALWLPVRNVRRDLRLRDGFVVVVLFWTVLAGYGALPFIFTTHPHMPLADAFFESMSGLTTTGATVLTGIDHLPESIRYYRQQLQWLGGMGIIVLAVAILPMLGIGGMQLYRAETPGPIKDNKLTPRITETAKALWFIYLGLTVLGAGAYYLAGMDLFDAIAHSFSTVATGGFSTHDESIGYFNSAKIDVVAMVFMLISGINFGLHFIVWRSRRLQAYLADSELKAYLGIMVVAAVSTAVVLYLTEHFEGTWLSIRHGVFQVISILTSTGYTTQSFDLWPLFLPPMLLAASCIGGCAGSTAGGIKMIRVLLLYKQGRREMLRLLHPSAIMPIKVGGKPVSDHVIDAVWGFFSLYVLCLTALSLILSATGLDLVTAFSAVVSSLNNLGPALGEVADNYAAVNPIGKWILSFTMLLGRLELFTVLVLLTPAFWRG